MRSLILIHALILISFFAKGQEFKPYRVDDSVQVSIPPTFQKKDTLGQHIISAGTQFGNILIIKTPDDPNRTPEIQKKKHLDAFYENYVKNISSSVEGSIVSDERDTVINNLRYKDFTLQADSGGGKQFRNFRIVHVNSATYIFQFLYQDVHKEYAAENMKTFFNSIKIPPDATVANQFTETQNTTGTPPSGSNYSLIGWIIGGVIVIALIIYLIRRRKRR